MSAAKALEGQPAPDFSLDSSSGTVRLADCRGKAVVLYFFPRADTPGCTTETCAFRDLQADFEAANALIFGISRDTVEDQQKFAEKYHVPFPLLADPTLGACEAYGVWVEKTMYGKKSMGIERTTFLIGPDGLIQKVYPRVKVDQHAEAVLADIRALAA